MFACHAEKLIRRLLCTRCFAGSFGRVYKGKWRGLDVAVKVLQHSRAAAASVANEVDLMMSFQHPNVVSAHHFVSWRKRQPPKIDNFDAEVGITRVEQATTLQTVDCRHCLGFSKKLLRVCTAWSWTAGCTVSV